MDVAEILKKSENSVLLITFTTDWSGASHIQNIYSQQLTEEFSPHVHLLQFDDTVSTAEQRAYFNVSTIPTTVLLKHREVIGFWEGLTSKSKMRQVIEAHLT